MNKVNNITFCLRDYESIEEGLSDVYTALRILLDAGYIVNIRYDEPGLKIVCLEFESADKSLGAAYPYWLTPEQAETLYFVDTTDDAYDETEDSPDTYTPQEITAKLNSIAQQTNGQVHMNIQDQDDYMTPVVQKYATKLSKNDLESFNSFWSSILYDKDGALDVNQMMLELLDYAYILKQLPSIYSTITGGVLSKPYYDAQTVIKAYEEHSGNIASQARLIADDWDIITEECKTNSEYKKAVLDYLNIEED